MRRLVARCFAPFDESRTYYLKGKLPISPPTIRGIPVPSLPQVAISSDLADAEATVTSDLLEAFDESGRFRHAVAMDLLFALPQDASYTVETLIPHPGIDDLTEPPLLVPASVEIPATEFDLRCTDYPKPSQQYEPIPLPDVKNQALPEIPQISQNLLEPLTSVVDGKVYGIRAPQTELPAQGELFDAGTSARGGIVDSFRKAYTRTAGRVGAVRNVATIWDLLLPILKPRLDISQPLGFLLPGELYPFQVVGVQHLIEHPAFLLADEMGTGKTVMTCVAIRMLVQQGLLRRLLIVCPKSVLSVWDRHLQDWASSLAVTVVSGPRDIRSIDWKCPAHVYVTNYETLRNDLDQALNDSVFDAVILDEAHRIKNASSKISRAVRRVSNDGKVRWALSGTPIQNEVEDLIALFRFVEPSVFRGFHCPPSSEEARAAIAPYFLRRRKKDVIDDLPSKLRTDEWLDLDQQQVDDYNRALEKGTHRFKSGEKEFTKWNAFQLMGKLKRICNFAEGQSFSPKCETLLEQVEEIVANDKKLLVFSQYVKEGVDKLTPLLEKFGLVSITGKTSDRKRREAVERFQDDDSAIRVFVGQVKAAGEGITLTRASYVVHFDHWWNPAIAWQAEDRAHRKGQTETVNVYLYWMRGTVEERIKKILEDKGLLHAEIIDSMSREEIDASITIDDLLDVFGLESGQVNIPASEKRRTKDAPSLSEIFDALQHIDPYEFENVVMRVFRDGLEFANARVTQRSADGGIDVEATKAAQDGIERIVVQCKRMRLVGEPVARDLLGVVARSSRLTKGYLVTSGRLSPACEKWMRGEARLEAITGIELAKLIRDHKIDIFQQEESPNATSGKYGARSVD